VSPLLLVKGTCVLVAALATARLWRQSAAKARHRLWTTAFAALLALPLLTWSLPAIDIRIPTRLAPMLGAATTQDPSDGAAQPIAAAGTALDGPGRRASSPAMAGADAVWIPVVMVRLKAASTPAALVFGAWLAGASIATIALLVSLARARRLTAAAADISDSGWDAAARALSLRLGLRQPPRLIVHPAVTAPMAAGLWRPRIFLPAAAPAWSDECRDVVLAHEIAHLASRDPLRHLLARLAVALYWFHPLAWLAARASAIAREQACDEAVLALGVRPSVYARVLMDLADSLQPAASPAGVLPMVDRSRLEARLMNILTPEPRTQTRARVLALLAGAVVFTLSLAAAQPAPPLLAVAAPKAVQAPAAAPASVSTDDRVALRDQAAAIRATESLRDHEAAVRANEEQLRAHEQQLRAQLEVHRDEIARLERTMRELDTAARAAEGRHSMARRELAAIIERLTRESAGPEADARLRELAARLDRLATANSLEELARHTAALDAINRAGALEQEFASRIEELAARIQRIK
jgi:beta-lactamase regulating signal transducer with metallopeptidase domain